MKTMEVTGAVSLSIIGGLGIIDAATIFLKDKTWLVTGWLPSKDGLHHSPRRIICIPETMLSKLPQQSVHSSSPIQLPNYLFDHDNPIPNDSKFEGIEFPQIQVPLPKAGG